MKNFGILFKRIEVGGNQKLFSESYDYENSINSIVELHSMLLTISHFMFWEDHKTFTKSIISLLIFG